MGVGVGVYVGVGVMGVECVCVGVMSYYNIQKTYGIHILVAFSRRKRTKMLVIVLK